MFCMGCGAETPPRAARCPVCGRDVSFGAGGPPLTMSVPSSKPVQTPSSTTLTPASVTIPIPLTQPASVNGALASTPATDGLPAPVLPRDALGVTLLVVCAAMALDILAPWSESYSVRQSLVSRFGHPAFVVVALALVAALPLYRPQWRRSPLCAAAPLAIGALSVGVGLTYYIFLARENAQAVSNVNGGYPPLGAQPISTTPISPQLGIYLYILIGVVLVVVGYQLFLAAVRSQYIIIAPPQVYPQGVVQMAGPALVMPMPVPAAIAQSNGSAGVPSPASVPLTSIPLMPATVAPFTAPSVAAAPSQPAIMTPQPVVPATPSAPFAPVTPGASPATAHEPSSRNGASQRNGLALPGTDAWNEEPVSPVVNKQSRMRGGWRYSSR